MIAESMFPYADGPGNGESDALGAVSLTWLCR